MRFIRDLSWENQKMLERIYKESQHHQVRQRAKCILLSFQKWTIEELMKIFIVTRKTIYNWLIAWEDKKLIGLYNRRGRGRKEKLTEAQKEQIIFWVKEEPKSLKKVQIKIHKEWGIEISKDTIKRIIKKFQMRWKRVKRGLSKKADEWELEVKLPALEELKEKDKKGEIDLRYFDEVGWGLRPCIPYAWQEKDNQIILKDVEGKRINVLGAMNIRNDLFYQQYEGTITSKIVIEFLDKFSENLEIKTVVVMDQASLHTSNEILQKLDEWKEKKLEIFWLPTYSPQLNLIEILWRFMKYEWIEVSAYQDRESLLNYVKKVLECFGSEYVINFA
jgi:transposase